MKKTTSTTTNVSKPQPKRPHKAFPTGAKEWHRLDLAGKAWTAEHPDASKEEKDDHIPSIDRVRSRGWMLTIPVEGKHPHDEGWVRSHLSRSLAAVFSEEKGSHTGYLHFQAFQYLRNPTTGAHMRKVLKGEGIHVEPSWSTTELCARYCSKEATHIQGPFWLGHPEEVEGMRPTAEQTERHDRYGELVEELRDGRTYEQLVLDPAWGPWALRNRQKVQDVRAALLAQTVGAHDREVSCDYVWGEGGTGKTSSILDLYGGDDIFIANLGSTAFPFDGYNGEPVLLLDDFRTSLSFTELLRVLDCHPLPLNVKGGRTFAAWTKVVVSSNIAITEQYPNIKEHRDPLYRRFSRGIVFEMPRPGVKLPYDSKEDAMLGKRNDGGELGVPGYRPAWERTPDEQNEVAFDDMFSA